MGTVVYYFFCHACGGDTASFDLGISCPYCRAGRRDFQLVGEAATPEQQREIQLKVEELRRRWAEQHGDAVPGDKPRRRRWFRRG
jgi:hypothetical protein